MSVSFAIPDHLDQIRDAVRKFVARELKPHEQEVDKNDDLPSELNRELRMRAVELGVYGFNISADLGGGGVGPLGEALIGIEAGRTSITLGEVLGRIPQSLALCRPDQMDWLLKPVLRAEKTVCVALTEPDAGSDLSAIRTRAVRNADGWILNGNKQFISHAETSDYILVLAVSEPAAPLSERCTLLAVPRESPGLHFTHRARKMGWHGYHISDFSLDDCSVGEDAVIGEPGKGFEAMMASVNATRLYIAARCVGTAEECLKLATQHANTRRTFNQLLGEHQAIQFKLADMDVELEAARLLVYAAVASVEEGSSEARIAASRAKLYATEMAGRATDAALQIFGGSGYMSDLPIERMYRDMRGYRIGEGTSEIQRIQIARSVLKRHWR